MRSAWGLEASPPENAQAEKGRSLPQQGRLLLLLSDLQLRHKVLVFAMAQNVGVNIGADWHNLETGLAGIVERGFDDLARDALAAQVRRYVGVGQQHAIRRQFIFGYSAIAADLKLKTPLVCIMNNVFGFHNFSFFYSASTILTGSALESSIVCESNLSTLSTFTKGFVMSIVTSTYQAEIEAWRAEAEAKLRADDGWLTVAGLFWLEEGDNSIGASEECSVIVPGDAPALLGYLRREGKRVSYLPVEGSPLLLNGRAVNEATEINLQTMDSPDLFSIGEVSFFVMQRGERIGVRLRDKQSHARRNFKGRTWFPVDESYVIEGRYISYPTPKVRQIVNVLGDVSEEQCPGEVHFELHGQSIALEVSSASKNGLFIVFRDATAGHETYGASRFLYTSAPDADGKVILDFNRAVSPPCAFTDYATCPLPSAQNRINLRIEAGETYNGPQH